ncbi:MAG: hypothetical protein CL930_11130 [Deltaproteobacteria bacterium]|nr:hypothetical protein [Deltaproteobacteria bacterium]
MSNRLPSGHKGAILDLKSGQVSAMIDGQAEGYGVSVSPKGDRFILTSNEQSATVLNSDGEVIQSLPVATPPGYATGWSPDGQIVAVADFSGRYQLWTSDNWEMVANFGHQSMSSALLFSPTGRTLNVVTGFGGVYALNLNGPGETPSTAPSWLQTLRGHIVHSDIQASLETSKLASQDSKLARIWTSALQQ